MKRRTRVRLLVAAPWLFAGGVCNEIGHLIYGRRFEVSDR